MKGSRTVVGRKEDGRQGCRGAVEQRQILARVTIDFVYRALADFISDPVARARAESPRVLAKSYTYTRTDVYTRVHIRRNHQSSHRVESDGWSACETRFIQSASIGEITPEIGVLFD